MNHCAIQHNYIVADEELRGSAAAAGGGSVERRETVVCPKPRRLGQNHTTLYDPYPMKPRRWHICHHQREVREANAANEEVLDIILAKGSCGADRSVAKVASPPPPFFPGSPPRRVSNPLIQDARFLDEKFVAPRAIPIKSGRLVRESFGSSPSVRIEGFDCLDRDCAYGRRNRHIPALA